MEEIKYWIALKKLPKVGDVTFLNLLKQNKSIDIIFNEYNCDTRLKDSAMKFAEEEISNCINIGIKFLKFNDSAYPTALKEIHSPPPFLYYIGNIDVLKKKNKVAIVGSRNPTDYGKNICYDIIKEIVKYNIVTVSGFARGIDTIAHKVTLENNGETIAILGNGFNIIYPSSNRKLFNIIKEKGILLTEFSLDTKPEPGNFPKRNRIISGLSKAVIVVEASIKSGSLITAEFAVNQGRDVFAVPGNVYSYKSKGTNFLIKNGAYLLENGKDILENSFPETLKNNTVTKKKIKFENETLEKIYNIIKENPLTIDNIVEITNMKITDILPIITQLEILGYIREQTGKFYVK